MRAGEGGGRGGLGDSWLLSNTDDEEAHPLHARGCRGWG